MKTFQVSIILDTPNHEEEETIRDKVQKLFNQHSTLNIQRNKLIVMRVKDG